MDLLDDVAGEVLNVGYKDPGTKQTYRYCDGKLYEFQSDNAGTYYGYPISGNEVPAKALREMLRDGVISSPEYGKLIKGK